MNDTKKKLRQTILHRPCHLVVSSGNISANDAIDLALTEFKRIESLLSSYQPGSLIYALNSSAGTGEFVELNAEARSLFSFVDMLWQQSNQLFDPTTSAAQPLYGSERTISRLEKRIDELQPNMGWHKLELTESGGRLLEPGMRIDLDSIVRPYAVDRVRKKLIAAGIKHALIDLDHDVATIGTQPDGSNWLIGLRYPKGNSAAISRLKLNQQGYALRGSFEHSLSINGEQFGRAISPIDGLPLLGPISVAVVAQNCLDACSAANIARTKTEAAALDWLSKLNMPWFAIDRQGKCHGTLASKN
ncbi:MAG: FAD:protein FMN transferase [Halioglobus sp.]